MRRWADEVQMGENGSEQARTEQAGWAGGLDRTGLEKGGGAGVSENQATIPGLG